MMQFQCSMKYEPSDPIENDRFVIAAVHFPPTTLLPTNYDILSFLYIARITQTQSNRTPSPHLKVWKQF